MRLPLAVLSVAALFLIAGCCNAERDGEYTGPNEAFVLVKGDTVYRLQLRYAGNAGFTFASQKVNAEGMWTIQDGTFTVRPTTTVTITGAFENNCEIKGTWQDGEVTGTWKASH